MLYTESMENNVLTNFEAEVMSCSTKDSINKLYRQARIWVRFHCHYANACSPEHSRELNEQLKQIRVKALSAIEGE